MVVAPTSSVTSTDPEEASEPALERLSPLRLFVRFLQFGLMAWGGPVAQIAMIRRDLVDEERWVSSRRFNRLLAVYQALPGPEAHELCVHLGMMRGGRIGGVAAGLGFMLPGFLLMLALSWAYFRLDMAGLGLGPVFLGVQVGVLALIARAVHRIGGHILLDHWLWVLAVGAGLLSLLGSPFWLVLPAAGVLYALVKAARPWAAVGLAGLTLAGAAALALMGGQTGATSPSAGTAPGGDVPATLLLLSGLKAGLLTFGGAYTAIPFVRADAVERGWMSDGQFLDGLALSGVLPAPLIIFVTFVGYAAGGPIGAVAVTAGVFLPAFGFTLLFYDRLEAVIENTALRTFLAGVSAGVVGLIGATFLSLGQDLTGRLPELLAGMAIFAGALAILYLWRSKAAVLAVVIGAGVAGWLAF
jgi:chromate transporter